MNMECDESIISHEANQESTQQGGDQGPAVATSSVATSTQLAQYWSQPALVTNHVLSNNYNDHLHTTANFVTDSDVGNNVLWIDLIATAPNVPTHWSNTDNSNNVFTTSFSTNQSSLPLSLTAPTASIDNDSIILVDFLGSESNFFGHAQSQHVLVPIYDVDGAEEEYNLILEYQQQLSFDEADVEPTPLAAEQIEKLPSVVCLDNDVGTTCGICLDTVCVNDVLLELPCKHMFHQDCIVPWLGKCNSCCPTCRYECDAEKR